jgi:hypothetical protein
MDLFFCTTPGQHLFRFTNNLYVRHTHNQTLVGNNYVCLWVFFIYYFDFLFVGPGSGEKNSKKYWTRPHVHVFHENPVTTHQKQ